MPGNHKQLTMKRSLFTALCISTALLSYSQAMSDAWFEEYLEEKVRVPEYREVIDNLMEYHDKVESGEMTRMEAELQLELDLQSAQRAIEYREAHELDLRTVDESALGTGGAEPFIALHPTDPNRLILSYMESGSAFDYPIFYTTDGGTTWTQSSFSTASQHAAEFSGATIMGGGDPVLAYEGNGTIHMSWIYLRLDGFALNAAMLYAYSTDDGATFTIPTGGDHIIFDGSAFPTVDMLDRQWFDTDHSGGTYDGNLYMSAIYFGGALGPEGEVVLTKPSGTNTFNPPVVAVSYTSPEGAQFGNVKVDDNGVVHMGCVKFTDQSTGVGNVAYVRSTDGGTTWSTPVLIAPVESKLPNGSGHMVHDRDNTAASLAVAGSDVYMAWCDQASSDTRAFYAVSNDAGLTWGSAVEVGPTQYPGNYYHLMPNVCADGTNASISWYVVDKSTLAASYNILELTGSGATMGDFGYVSTSNFDFSDANSGDFFGDYNTSVRNGCDVWTIWSDNRSGSPMTYVAKVDACSITGLSEITAVNAGFSVDNIYPNPTVDQASIIINTDESMYLSIDIMDMSGRIINAVHAGTVGSGETILLVDTDAMATGTYIVRVMDEDGNFSSRNMVKQ